MRSDVSCTKCWMADLRTKDPPLRPLSPREFPSQFQSSRIAACRVKLTSSLARHSRKIRLSDIKTAVRSEMRYGKSKPVRAARYAQLQRRSSWPLAVLAVGYLVTYQIGLPDWVFQGTVVLTSVMMLATLASVFTTSSGAGPRWLQLRPVMNTSFGGLGVFALVVFGYVGLRAFGIGPAAALTATGALEEQDRMIVAEFENRTSDSLIGRAVSEALRVDLAQSPVISVVTGEAVSSVLPRMQLPPGTLLTNDLAREMAVREGYEALLEGEITPVGTGYQLAARLVGVAEK